MNDQALQVVEHLSSIQRVSAEESRLLADLSVAILMNLSERSKLFSSWQRILEQLAQQSGQ
jgi:hypothetical protein